MSSDRLFEPLPLARGPAMKNRFMLAPLTNRQSHADGTLSDVERSRRREWRVRCSCHILHLVDIGAVALGLHIVAMDEAE